MTVDDAETTFICMEFWMKMFGGAAVTSGKAATRQESVVATVNDKMLKAYTKRLIPMRSIFAFCLFFNSSDCV